ncbi:amino acid ABC transporter permease [Lactobacillus acetotolerans]|uniref:Amino acid ABC transporter permease n=1 Tax=Lactobacillus acetotolerans TaxID=1600 RepID=A0A5P5ZIY7_9LACO|nr:amino acid ABC transporter permease [Lactobacillus acetotolerans]KRN39931.1 ABC transporter, permease protein [Lactobacillus acetotolerans DSM 20749 = JCM 3825]QFG51627.1 amino acid ABC transporter permease [Lactobacillus acetotolerans]GGV15281.1 glutamine ABC transporter permease [Lactobacillus acetotolerans DSM 20749 = JCM 3825]
METFIHAYSWIDIRFLLQGLWVTIYVSVISIILSFILGLICGLVRYMKIKYLSAAVGFVVDIIRNLPLLLIIFFTYFGLPKLGLIANPTIASIVALVVFEGAMLSEIVRSGINSVPTGQMEGARSNGMTYVQAMIHVVLPQAIRNMVPAILSQFVSLIKDTSLATIIVLPELLYHAQIIYSQNTSYLIPMYLIIAVMYFIVCFCLSKYANHLQKKYL